MFRTRAHACVCVRLRVRVHVRVREKEKCACEGDSDHDCWFYTQLFQTIDFPSVRLYLCTITVSLRYFLI